MNEELQLNLPPESAKVAVPKAPMSVVPSPTKKSWFQSGPKPLPVLLCRALAGGKVQIAGAKLSRKHGMVSHVYGELSVDAAKKLSGKLKNRFKILGLLPKHVYLIRDLELPVVSADEQAKMLVLESEARVPSGYGEVSIGYRQVPAVREGQRRYEIYVAKRQELQDEVDKLAAAGVEVDAMVPGAAAWACALEQAEGFDMLVARTLTDEIEAAVRDDAGGLALRVIQTNHPGWERELAECVRPVLARRVHSDDPLHIGWVGREFPAHLNSDAVQFKEMSFQFIDSRGVAGEAGDESASLAFLARALAGTVDPAPILTALMLPQAYLAQKSRALSRRHLMTAGLLFMASLASVVFGLEVLTKRYTEDVDQLRTQVTVIRKDGQGIGRRLGQLKAVAQAQATRNDMLDVIQTLLDATPQGVTYNYVELTSAGKLILRGQTDQLSVVFKLPERLEASPLLKNVTLQDVGQAKKGEGAIAEFKIECFVVRAL